MVLPLAADGIRHGVREGAMRLCVGDDWAEDHHDVEVMDEAGTVLATGRLPEGVAGIGQLHELIGRFVPADGDAEVQVGIETDRGPWVAALIAAGYVVFAVNPLQASRYRGRRGVSGAKSDGGDAHMLADAVRTDAHQLRPAAGGSPAAEAVKVLARTHKTLIGQRSAAVLRLRAQLPGVLPGRTGAAGQGTGPRPRREADPRPGLGGPPARRAPQDHGADRRDPGRAAQPAAGPAARPDRRLRRYRAVPDRGDRHLERAGRQLARAGGSAFWPAPGR